MLALLNLRPETKSPGIPLDSKRNQPVALMLDKYDRWSSGRIRNSAFAGSGLEVIVDNRY